MRTAEYICPRCGEPHSCSWAGGDDGLGIEPVGRALCMRCVPREAAQEVQTSREHTEEDDLLDQAIRMWHRSPTSFPTVSAALKYLIRYGNYEE